MTEKYLMWWLILGLLPYKVQKENLGYGQSRLEIQALFWVLEVKRRRNDHRDWKLQVPFIEKLRNVVWAAVMQFKEK